MHKKIKNFKEIRINAGLFKIDKAAEFLGVTKKTINNWDKSGAPIIALRALEFRAGIAEKWQGFFFSAGKVITPVNDEYTAVEVELIKYFNIHCYKLGAYSFKIPKNLAPEIPQIRAFARARDEFKARSE